AVTQGDDRAHDRRRARVAVHAGYQQPIELYTRDGQLLERGERGAPDAEVIERERHAERAQAAQRIDGGGAGLEPRLGDLELERAGWQPGDFQRAGHMVDRGGLAGL